MPVTDNGLAALRAHLQGNQALQQELYEQITTPTAKTRYTTLLATALALVSDAEYDDDQPEAFLAEARKAADDRLAH
jgi:hypothetical protein